MNPLRLRVTHGASVRWGLLTPISSILLCVIAIALTGCGPSVNRYLLIEQSLLAGDPQRAVAVLQETETEYGAKGKLLFGMDRGLVLQLAGNYQHSNTVLEQADDEVERLYTRTIRSETAAFLTNDNALPYEGDAYEHVMINVVKALNYAVQGEVQDALVEVRRIDHRLNVLGDRVKDATKYRTDGFARYLCGILYEAAGDFNNAFIAYRNAYDAYSSMRGWARMSAPLALRADLLRTSEALHLTTEFEAYRQAFPTAVWQPASANEQLAQVVMISYNGRAPRKEDSYVDLPISLDALQLVLINRGLGQSPYPRNRAADSLLYGLSGQVVRVALPRLVAQKTRITSERLVLTDSRGESVTAQSELVHNVTALAEKSLSERMPGIAVKAVARAATKFAMAEGAVFGAQRAVGRDAAPLVGLLVGLLAKGLAVASEEADKRSWQTLPDEIHLARMWVPAGSYQLAIQPAGLGGSGGTQGRSVNLAAGQTLFMIQRLLQ